MTVGIITWYGVTNYGSALQAYALQQLIKQAGEDAAILRHAVHEARLSPRRPIKSWRDVNPRRHRAHRGEFQKQEAVAQFRDEYLNVTDSYIDQCKVGQAVIGSDQIFDVAMNQRFQFGIGVDAKSVSTYAPSFGMATLDDVLSSPYSAEIQSAIKKMAGLSARDENTREILESISGESVPVVVDPTLAYNFTSENSAWITDPPFERYLLIYSWSGRMTDREFSGPAQAFARAHKLKTVSLGDYRPWCDYNAHGASPQEFVSLISQATAFITNMFHGTCFALSHQVPVMPIVESHNVFKLGGLLNQFDLAKHQVHDLASIATADIPSIDYDQFSQVLAAARSSSLEFLERTISDDN